MPRTVATVAIFHQEIIARVAIRKARNIVPLSQIKNFFCTSKIQKINREGIIKASISNTNSPFSLDTSTISEKYNLTVKTNITISEVPTNQDVNHGILSLQLIELNTKTYHKIVKNRGII